MTIKCNKNLKFGDGSLSFTKGQEYETNNITISELTVVLKDNQGKKHRLGLWYKHFKIVK